MLDWDWSKTPKIVLSRELTKQTKKQIKCKYTYTFSHLADYKSTDSNSKSKLQYNSISLILK